SPLAENIDCVARPFLDKTRSPQGNGQHGRAAGGAGGPFDRAARPTRLQRHSRQRTKGRRHGQGLGDPAHTGRSMPVRAIQKKWAPRAVLFPWEIGGYMALAVLIAVMADRLAWALDIGVAVLAGAAAACIVQFALSRNLSMANSAGQRVRAKILTHYVLGTMEGRVAEAFRKADENPQDGEARRDAGGGGPAARCGAALRVTR